MVHWVYTPTRAEYVIRVCLHHLATCQYETCWACDPVQHGSCCLICAYAVCSLCAGGTDGLSLGPVAGHGGGGGVEDSQVFPDAWDGPDTHFELFVGETVKHRLGKYVQPEHPNRISKQDAQILYRWVDRVVM